MTSNQVEVNKISSGKTSGEEYEINEIYKGRKWNNNNQYKKPSYGNRPKILAIGINKKPGHKTKGQVSLGRAKTETPRSP